MSVRQIDGYTDGDRNSNRFYTTGAVKRTVQAHCTKPASDIDGDVFRLVKNVPLNAQVAGIRFPKGFTAVAGLTGLDFGVYKAGGETALDQDCFIDGLDLSSNIDAGYDALGDNVSSFDFTEDIYTKVKAVDAIGSDVDQRYHGGVDICMTVVSGASLAADIQMEIDLVFPG